MRQDYAIVKHYQLIAKIASSMVYAIGLYWYHSDHSSRLLFLSFVGAVLLVISSLSMAEKLLKAATEQEANKLSEFSWTIHHVAFIGSAIASIGCFFFFLALSGSA